MRIRLALNAFVTAVFFGFWQDSTYSGLFMLSILGFCLSTVDYTKVWITGDKNG